jgi:hypothetical protein
MHLRLQVATGPHRSTIEGVAVAQGQRQPIDRRTTPTSRGADLDQSTTRSSSATSGAAAPAGSTRRARCGGRGPAETAIERSTSEASRLFRPYPAEAAVGTWFVCMIPCIPHQSTSRFTPRTTCDDGHEKLPIAGHEPARSWPSDLPTRGH